jgi:hypothetical protein
MVWGFESPPAHHQTTKILNRPAAFPFEKTMTVTVETLEKLERKITLTLPVSVIQNEVDSSA